MYCLANRRVRNAIRTPSAPTPPDPYGPQSAHYAERHRESVTELPNGLVRVDIGEPVHWAARKRSRPEPTPAPVAPEPAPAAPEATPTVQPTATPKVHQREHRAITRNP